MVDLDIDAGLGVISTLLSDYQSAPVKRDIAAAQLLTFVGEATQALTLTGDDHKQLEVYVMTLLRKLEVHEIDPETAAGDLGELRSAAELNDPSFVHFFEIAGD
jgi:hypothetical protein